VRAARILTALLVVGLCAFPMFRGWEIVRFSIIEASVGASEDANIFQPWVGVSGLAFSARDDSLRAITKSSGEAMLAKQLDGIAEILSVRPISSGYWYWLSRTRFYAGQSLSKVMEAWSLSVLTGANEGTVMPWRGILGLSLWDRASPEVKSRAIKDLAAALPEITEQQQLAARAILLEKPENVRQEIRAQLLADGAPPNRLAGIGL
jgi:hypothetical protein